MLTPSLICKSENVKRDDMQGLTTMAHSSTLSTVKIKNQTTNNSNHHVELPGKDWEM